MSEVLTPPVRELEEQQDTKVPESFRDFIEELDIKPSWEEMRKDAEGAFNRFSSSLAEGVPEHLSDEQFEDVGCLLGAWNFAYERSKAQWFPGEHFTREQRNYWDNAISYQSEAMNVVLNPDFREMYLTWDPEEGVGTGMKGLPYLEELLLKPEFDEREALLSYLTHQVWVNQASLVRIKNSVVDHETDERVQAAEMRLEQSKERIHPILVKAAKSSAVEGNLEALGQVFEHFRVTDEKGTAAEVLLGQDMTYEERETLMISYIQTFGFVDAVDTLSRGIAETADGTEVYKQDLERLYSEFQGDNVALIMQTLTDVYESVDFNEYALNSQELTQEEVDLIEGNVLDRFTSNTGRSREDITLMDLAAGTGRHTMEMLRRHAVGRVIDVEYEAKHVALIKEQNPDVEVIQGSWYSLPFKTSEGEDATIDVFDVLGRSLHHARKTHEMLKIFDELQRVTSSEAVGIFDVGAVEGDYEANLRRFRDNLRAKGIDIDETRAKLIFDGPDNEHRFNRMLLDDPQVDAFLGLTGFRVAERIERVVDESRGVKNVYYVVEKDPDYDPRRISREVLYEELDETGVLFDPGSDYNMYVEAWGMTVGQALLGGLDNEHYRELNKSGNGPEILVDIVENEYGQKGLRLTD